MNWFESLRDLSHREAAGRLLADGWNVCGLGDWATVWRSPDGALVARVSPFEPAYEVFVELCRTLDGHPLLPRIEFDAPLMGGGRLTVMEFLMPVEPAVADAVVVRWAAAADGDPITVIRREAERLDAEAGRSIPFWGGLDHNPGNVLQNPAGEPKLVDLFYAAGLEIYRVLRDDPARIAEAVPADRRRFICDIAALARLSSPDELAALRAAADSLD
ncbi:hypothetical protein [Promicromonospora sp. MEB111]|uniref:hypothetical protein n=1 Tax=Promicromonospora sp. MEB111 TaxID=3040301 RepID=UPI00254ED135|nr:hypothetical protein [Promicromonospora sp. MEB111]